MTIFVRIPLRIEIGQLHAKQRSMRTSNILKVDDCMGLCVSVFEESWIGVCTTVNISTPLNVTEVRLREKQAELMMTTFAIKH